MYLPVHTVLLLLVLSHISPCSAYFSRLWSSSIPVQDTDSLTDPRKRARSIGYNANGTPFVWIPVDEYSGTQFFEYVISPNIKATVDYLHTLHSRWDFFTGQDPTKYVGSIFQVEWV